MTVQLSLCEDYQQFQRTLKRLRDVDDKIAYALNLSTPTASMVARGADPGARCAQLRSQLLECHEARRQLVGGCVELLQTELAGLRAEQREGAANLRQQILGKQQRLRMVEAELGVEQIITARTEAAFKAKCGEHL